MIFVHEYLEYTNETRDNGWWSYECGNLVNRVGGYHEADSLDSYKEKVECDSWETFMKTDIYRNSLILKDSKFGWLSPEGDFYGCDYRDHEKVATYYFGKDEEELEESGWAKITLSMLDHIIKVYNDDELTNKQIIWLEDNGFRYENYDWIKEL